MVKTQQTSELPNIRDEAGYELIATKLAPPRLHPLFVPRQRLLARLDEGMEHKLTLISAPAGFGKTTLMSEWIAFRREQRSLPPLAWVTLDPGDNDLVRFWRYVLTASESFAEDVSESALAFLNSSPQPPISSLVTLFINELDQLPSKAVLVLEDYHAISATQVHEALTFFIDHLPPSLHLILMTRGDPPLPLAHLRARNDLTELRAEELRFSEEEVIAFLGQALPFSLSHDMAARIANRTEGWAAGLRLLSLALNRQGEAGKIEHFLDTFTGSHRPVMDYFLEDVFGAQPEPLQQFLLQSSVLSRLTGSLCNSIMKRNDGAAILEQLERDNLFLVSLDAAQHWYRFHALFAEAMQHLAQQRLGEARLRELSRAASFWYEAHGMEAEAVEAALTAQEYSRAAGLIERIIAPRIVQNEYHTLRRWADQLPEDVLQTHPEVCMIYAAAILFTSDRRSPLPFEIIQHPLKMAEQQWRDLQDESNLGKVMAFHALLAWRQGDFLHSFSSAKHALELLPEKEAQWRGSSLIFVGMEEMFAGKLNAARQTLTQARIINQAVRNAYAAINATLSLAEVYARQGALKQAAELCEQALAEIERAPMEREDVLQRRGRAMAGIGALSLEWNDLDAAEQYASQGLEIADQIADENILAKHTIIMARLRFIRGEISQSQQMLLRLVSHAKNPLLLREIQAQHAWLALQSGDQITARRWQDGLPRFGDALARIQEELEALVMARLLIAQGEAGESLLLLAEWLFEAQEQGRVKSVLEITILMAMAHAALNHLPDAQRLVVEALALGQAEGYRRIFLNEGQRLAALLQAARSQMNDESLITYARALLYTLAQEQNRQEAFTKAAPERLIEPLSEQELRVLRLLAAGLSTPEIGEQLVISVNTAKTHVKNIYGKLGVNSREQAREAAQYLRILR